MADTAALSILVYRKTADLLAKLTEDQLSALLDGTGDLAFVSAETTVRAGRSASTRSRATKTAKPGLDEVAERLAQFANRDEAAQYLETTRSITKADLVAIGGKLGFKLSENPNRPQIIKTLVASVVGSKSDFNTVSGPSHQR